MINDGLVLSCMRLHNLKHIEQAEKYLNQPEPQFKMIESDINVQRH